MHEDPSSGMWTHRFLAVVAFVGSLAIVEAHISVAYSAEQIAEQKRRRGIAENVVDTIAWAGTYFESARCSMDDVRLGSCACKSSRDLTIATSQRFECVDPDHVICDVSLASFGSVRGSCNMPGRDHAFLQQGSCHDHGNFRSYVDQLCINKRYCVVSPCAFLSSVIHGDWSSDIPAPIAMAESVQDAIVSGLGQMMPCLYNSSLNSLGWGMMIPQCIKRSECLKQYSLFDQIRLGIYASGKVAQDPLFGTATSAGGINEEMRQYNILDSQLELARKNAGCEDPECPTCVCAFAPPLLLPDLPDLYLTQGYPTPPMLLEVSGVEPLELHVASVSNDTIVRLIEGQRGGAGRCGLFKRVVRIHHADNGEIDVHGTQVFRFTLKDALGKEVQKLFTVHVAEKPRLFHNAEIVLTQGKSKVMTAGISGIAPLHIEAKAYTGDKNIVKMVRQERVGEGEVAFTFEPSKSDGGVRLYSFHITDGNGAKEVTEAQIHVVPKASVQMDGPEEMVLTVLHSKNITGHVQGFGPITFDMSCGDDDSVAPYITDISMVLQSSNTVSSNYFVEVAVPPFQNSQLDFITCMIKLTDGNGVGTFVDYRIRVVPLPSLDLSDGAELFATVGHKTKKVIPRFYGFPPLRMNVHSSNQNVLSEKTGTALIEDPEYPLGIVLHISPLSVGTAKLDFVMVDANGAAGAKQFLTVHAVAAPEITIVNGVNSASIGVDRGRTSEPIGFVLVAYKSVQVSVVSDRDHIVPNKSIRLRRSEQSITTEAGHGMVHESRELSFDVTPGDVAGGATLTIACTDGNGAVSQLLLNVVAKKARGKSKYEKWKEKQARRV